MSIKTKIVRLLKLKWSEIPCELLDPAAYGFGYEYKSEAAALNAIKIMKFYYPQINWVVSFHPQKGKGNSYWYIMNNQEAADKYNVFKETIA